MGRELEADGDRRAGRGCELQGDAVGEVVGHPEPGAALGERGRAQPGERIDDAGAVVVHREDQRRRLEPDREVSTAAAVDVPLPQAAS